MSARSRGYARLLAVAGLTAFVGLVGHACIIPDTYIQVRTTDENSNAVRLVEGIPLDEEAGAACDADTQSCPMAPLTALPSYLDPSQSSFQFCICGEDKLDDNRLGGVLLFAEDADEEEGEARDSLYAALLLDWNPTLGESAFDYVAYRSYLDPRFPLDLYVSSYEFAVIKRPRPFVRSITLQGESGRFDLCNEAGRDISPGMHTLTVMVTDRYWFQTEPTIIDNTDVDVETMPVVLEGVPDIAAGATYDIETYVFQCLEEGDEGCNCVETEASP
ncbi:hypothetical protein G6O69_27910 [Pseudenhygromyxa sp. WMMC2535]|uniref:hypothetical protein n=1 Tax=Pseudenhygromyxa sp. WMMC2535 TaxID=2712867 RepID=UPI0015545CDD|nr:hypothetical protein [Pseudenhygromyxa sp. WMMC2535]NVB41694.1 hypothetical protein [Pseudenhygromyxa sp. WMMC2535]